MASILDTTTVASLPAGRSFVFGTADYIVFVFMLVASAAVGVYFGFFSKSKNTTDEYLMGGKRMKTIPIAISLIASQLSALSITSVPAENYAFGINQIFLVFSMFVVAPLICYVITPVFYENNISNCYEYLEKRYNKLTRQLVTCTFILNAFLLLPVVIFIPSMAFAQVTGINIHVVNAVVCSICVFYTTLGGIKAVVWTDVLQGGIMLSSVVLVGILGTFKTGGLTKVFEYASEGGRMDVNLSLDPRVRITFWNSFICGTMMWTGHIGLNQSCVQRIVSLPSLKHAQRALWIAGIGFILVMGWNCFIGIVMYAYYHDCDPIKAGLVNKPDKMVPFFVQDIMGHLMGMPGLFISCVFSAALSSMSAMLNSMAGVVYFDYIRPRMKEYHTEARANFIMKLIIVAMGCYCVAGGAVVEHFDSIMQLVITSTGINTGSVVGVFLLGMLVPRTNGKVAVASIIFSVVGMFWIIIIGQMRAKEGAVQYKPLSSSIEGCAAHNLQVVMESIRNSTTNDLALQMLPQHIEEPKVTTAFGSNREFSIYEISFYWYKVIGVLLVWLLAIPLSYIWRRDEEEKFNPHLYSPFIRRFLGKRLSVEMEELPLKTPIPVDELKNDLETTISMAEK
ncbi:PREDICTED: sodium-coupled monocarboxylate transporter 1-like isoform X2 [Rhagoletis zephyria]|uniref:sodium-coupled monocarboxylate transporter 1-like isoform X2 n=1 Tax=Rhagoletis zephyria TaxID=28612 RepID=UPI0008114ED1|nr:PREDICTED: sodium-coupled monocarboxylate transporter 1-like isoform X2 [Rhagoletis zephyria]